MRILLCMLLAVVCVQSVSVTDVSLSAASQQAHHTQSYRLKTIQYMIVRRGQPFDLKITTDSALGNGQSLSLSTTPSLSMTTTVSGSGTQYVMTCQTQSSAPVGQFQITVTVSGASDNKPFTSANQPLVVLFNPYLQGDDVYMDDQSQLSEYIENEYENIWRGSLSSNSPMRWYLAQYNEHALTTALQLLSSFTGDASDVKAVSRHLSFAITYQSSNPSGLLVGNWGSNFNGGTAPWDWKGTDKITDQYVSSEFKPVKFAQCWVFGGTFLTLMRSMGIPSRQLTTFNSAHESPSDGKYTHVISRYYDSTGKMIQQAGSVWNFHSWNDAWMKRTDFAGTSGWQAVDSTPQELSDGVYQMGPAPLYSIKAKDDNAQWDTPFVISEVASVIHNYQVECSDGSCKITKDLGIDQEQVGGLITTSEPRTGNQQDITGDYKDLSNSASASASVMSVVMGHSTSPTVHRARYHTRAIETRRLKLKDQGGFVGFLASDDTALGQNVPVTVMFMGEPADGDQRIDFYVNVSFIDYRGMYMGDCMNTTQFVLLNKDNNYQAQYDFTVSNYWRITPVNPFLSISMYAENVETEMALIESIQVSVMSPPLTISAPHFIFVNSTFKPVTISFTNPIGMPLSNAHLSVQGPNLNLDTSANFATIAVGQTVYWSGFIKSGAVNGTQSILASLDCDQFYGVTASYDVEVIGVPFEMQVKLDAAHADRRHVERVKALSIF